MGLFIGASILTILELFDYLYEVRKCLQRKIILMQLGYWYLTTFRITKHTLHFL